MSPHRWTIPVVVTAVVLSACSSGAPAAVPTAPPAPPPTVAATPASRTVIDLAGRSVAVPARIDRIATVGATPVTNSILFVFGVADKLVNALPAALQKPDFKYQAIFAPKLASSPTIEGTIGQVNVEALTQLHPDVVFTNSAGSVAPIQAIGVPVVVLTWNTVDELKRTVQVLGQVFDDPQRAQAYLGYFDTTAGRVSADLSRVTRADWPRVLYLQLPNLSQPSVISEWWIDQAGGTSVTTAINTAANTPFTAEQVLQWNPQVIFAQAHSDADTVLSDPRFGGLDAVKNHQVYVVPVAAQHWGNATPETPLAMLWAATVLHPDQTHNIDVAAEVKQFYQQFYGYSVSDEQVKEILTAGMELATP
jgi:iron complex transport system substrate-binding protein